MYEIEAARIEEYIARLTELRRCLNVDGVKTQIAGFEHDMAVAGFWDDPESAQKVLQAEVSEGHRGRSGSAPEGTG